jgi:hypothetical protein
MHPAMMLKGITARFHDPRTGRDTRPESRAYQISDYVTAALNAGLSVRELSEHPVDADLAQRLPRAAKYLGWPMCFAMNLEPASR